MQTIKSRNRNAKVYLDGGHSAWNSAADQANRLRAAGVQYADGFFTNVSNFNSTAQRGQLRPGGPVRPVNGTGITGKRQVIDTSRNGGASGDWCGDDNTDRRIGQYPTLNTGDANIDALPVGEAAGRGGRLRASRPASSSRGLAFSLANGVPNPPAPRRRRRPRRRPPRPRPRRRRPPPAADHPSADHHAAAAG